MSGPENESEGSFLERLLTYRNREFSLFVPLLLGVVGPSSRGDGEGEEAEERRQGRQERLVLINPMTQGMIVIQGGSNLEALIREISEMQSGKAGPPPASKASIQAMPTVKIGYGDGGDAECAICLEDMEEAKEMPCGHRFHSNCIDKWLGMHGSCPCCRYAMPVEEEAKKGGGEPAGDEGRRREIWVSLSVTASARSDSSTGSTSTDQSSGEDQL